MELEEQLSAVRTRRDLADSIDALRRDLEENPDEWGNTTLDGFLDSLAGTIEGLDLIYENHDLKLNEDASWDVFAQIFSAARIRD